MSDDAKPRGCGCFDPRQASLVVSMMLLLLYGLASLGLLVDLSSTVLHQDGGRALRVGEAVALGSLLVSLAGAALLGRAVTTGAPRLLLGWLAWHGTCWVLAVLTAIAVAVTGGLSGTASPLILGVGSAIHALALVVLAYCGLVVLRYYRLLADSQLKEAANQEKEKEKEAEANKGLPPV